MASFYFVGGTALSYYLNHRVSYDLDFMASEKLDIGALSALSVRYGAHFIPDSKTSAFRINTGADLREFKMAFNFNGLKVEFFYPNDPVRLEVLKTYQSETTVYKQHIRILPLQAIAELKILALFRRNKIRDLFDLFALLEQNRISMDVLERFYSLEIEKETLVEYIESFADDGSESLDFEVSDIYYESFESLSHEKKLAAIKAKVLDLIITKTLRQKETMR